METLNNTKLEKLLKQELNDDLIDELIKSNLIMPANTNMDDVDLKDINEEGILNKTPKINMELINQDNKLFIQLFTNENKFIKANLGSNLNIEIKLESLTKNLLHDSQINGIIINPKTDNFILSSEDYFKIFNITPPRFNPVKPATGTSELLKLMDDFDKKPDDINIKIAFLKQLKNSSFYLPTQIDCENHIKDELKNKGDFKLEKDTKNELILFPREDGELFLPAFTSQSEIEKTPLKNFFIVLEFTKLLEIFKSNKDSMKYFVINPSDNPYELSVDLLLEIFNDPNMIDKLNS